MNENQNPATTTTASPAPATAPATPPAVPPEEATAITLGGFVLEQKQRTRKHEKVLVLAVNPESIPNEFDELTTKLAELFDDQKGTAAVLHALIAREFQKAVIAASQAEGALEDTPEGPMIDTEVIIKAIMSELTPSVRAKRDELLAKFQEMTAELTKLAAVMFGPNAANMTAGEKSRALELARDVANIQKQLAAKAKKPAKTAEPAAA